MKAVELMELPQAPVSDDTLILVATPDGPGRATLKEVRGLGLSGQETFFLATASASGITTDSEGWKEVPQATTADKRYLWSYTRFTYTDGKAVTTPPAIVGVYGNTGPKGDKGDTGPSVLKWFSMNSLGFTGGQDSVVQLEDFLAALQSKHGDGGIANIIWQNASSAKVTDGTTTISINGGHLVWGVNESVSNIDMEYGHGNLLSSHRWIGMEDERCRLRYSRNGDLQEDNCPPCPHRRPRVHPVQGAVCADHPVPRHKLE